MSESQIEEASQRAAGRRSTPRCPVSRLALLVLASLGLISAWARAAEEEASWRYDPDNARDIFDLCAGCHGANAQGGKAGTYPRIAGLEEEYIAGQLRAFKARARPNDAMAPYANERELPERDIRDIARYVSLIELPTEMPPPDRVMSALERLRAAQAVFNVPRVEGDVERGGALYADECSDCHGAEGWGEDGPQLAGQYTEYLRRQIVLFRSGERSNEDMDGVLDELDSADLEDIFAYLASRDD